MPYRVPVARSRGTLPLPVSYPGLFVFLALMVVTTPIVAAEEPRPSVLVCSSNGTWDPRVDLQWLTELQQRGWEPDYLDHHRDFTWERIRQYNVIVIYGCPPDERVQATTFGFPRTPPYQKEYLEILDRYLEAGGGVFCMAYVANADEGIRTMLDRWDVRLPLERYVEDDPARIVSLPRMRGHERAALVDQIFDSPITDGVRNLWMPYSEAYNTSWTAPIVVGDPWQVVVKGSKTSRTEPVDLNQGTMPAPPDALVREGGVPEPDLVAIRSYKSGRIYFACQWPQFTVGQGTAWLYDRLVLSKGAGGIESDYERLILNTFRWLAEPSLKSGKLGGFETPPGRLDPPNLRPEVRDEYAERYWPDDALERFQPWAGRKMYRGLIGVQSEISDGAGSVADYAAAAKQAGLDFIVFLEDFRKLTPERLKQLDQMCRQHSDETVALFPGYTVDNNVGNHMFFFGHDLPWPRPECLTGRNNDVLNIQYCDEQGKYHLRPVVLTWILDHDLINQQVGYYHFNDPRAMKMSDLKLCAAAAVFFYRDGKLIEDRTDDYLTTAQGTIPPSPVGVNLVRSPDELKREAAAGRGLTYAQARSVDELMADALRWSHQYDGMNISASNGPVIHAWPYCHRVNVYGGERFVLGRDFMPARLHVTSPVGLQQICIYNGRQLFRRFLPQGAKEYRQTLHLPGSVYRVMVLVAEDIHGKTAVSFGRRHWKVSVPKPVYCGDHVNDCGTGYLAHGPGQFRTNVYPEILGGGTWDGGPKGLVPVVQFEGNHPLIESDLGTEGDRPFNNTPILETADECALVVRSDLREVYDSAIPAVNAWHTYGPIDPSRLIDSTRRYFEFNRPAIRPQPTGWPAQPVRGGAVISCFENAVRFKQPQTVRRLRLVQSVWTKVWPLYFVLGDGDRCLVTNLANEKGGLRHRLETGGWCGVYSPNVSNSLMMINRGEPVVLVTQHGRQSALVRIEADLGNQTVEADQVHRYGLLAVSDAVDAPRRGPDRFLQIRQDLAHPEGLKILRGRREDSIGLIRVAADDGAVEIEMPRPTRRRDMPVPIRISGLNPRWSAGMLQVEGHSMGYYTEGENVYTPLGFDFDGLAYLSLFPDQAESTRVRAGHPIVCDRPELFIEVMPRPVAPGKLEWHVAVNNPTDNDVTATFRQVMDLPALEFATQKHTIAAGDYVVLLK